MKNIIYYIFDCLALDYYPYRLPIIAISITAVVGGIIGWFAFI